MNAVVTDPRGLQPARNAEMLEAMLHELGYLSMHEVDGRVDVDTMAAVRAFQRRNGLVIDGVAGPKTWMALFAAKPELTAQLAALSLSSADIDKAAQSLRLSVPAVRAVYKVESAGAGFLGLRPKILFEGHIFWRKLLERGIDPTKHVTGNEDVLYESWEPSHYIGGLGEHERLAKAKKIHEDAALESASWGMFQIMGMHWRMLGFGDVQSFVTKHERNEKSQLDVFGLFISTSVFAGKPLVQWLREKNWRTFARAYNGPAYEKHGYDVRLRNEYLANGGIL